MNIFIKSFSYSPSAKEDRETNFIHHPLQILSVLVSATCIGNDGRSNCPLFHGSLAPMIFGKTSDDNVRRLLLQSNNITWVQAVFRRDLRRFPTFQKEIFQTLSKTRYSSKSLKKLQVTVIDEEDKQNVLSFLRTSCEVLETLEIWSAGDFSLKDLASCRPLTNSLNRLAWSYQPIPDPQQLQHFSRLQEFCLSDTRMNDEQLHPLASLKNLRRLELINVKNCTGSFLDVVCPSLERLRVLEIREDESEGFVHISGLKHLANSLEELSLHDLPKLRGHEEWVDFPFLKKLNLVRVSFGYQEKLALSPDAFPSLDILEFDVGYEIDIFYSTILKGCQREESSRPIKRISIDNRLKKEGLEALLMVPVEYLNLDHTWFNNHIPSDIPWSEEKIITKTLKKFKCADYGNVCSIAFLVNCKQLESLELYRISPNINLSALSNLPLLKELSFKSPVEEKEKLFLIKDLFCSADENDAPVVVPSLQKLELNYEIAVSRFEGLENILPNLRILVSSTRVNERENDEDLLNSFQYLVRNFPKLEEISFNGKTRLETDKIFNPMNTQIPRLLKKEKPSLNIYYPGLCQYEPEPEKEQSRRDCD